MRGKTVFRCAMKILHVMRNTGDAFAWQTIGRQIEKKENRVSVLLLHDAVFSAIQKGGEVYACRDDVESRGVNTSASLVGYPEIVTMLLETDSVVCW